MVASVLTYHDVQLYASDVALVTTHGEWLNDRILHFYLQYLTQTRASRDVLLMDPAVVSCLVHQCQDKDEYVDLAKGVNVATRRLCLLPVADNDKLNGVSSHWSLLVYGNGTFRHFDSSAGHNKHAARRVAAAFERLLDASGRQDGAGASERVEQVADAPQQQNGYDCGIYVLLGAEYFCGPRDDTTSLNVYVTPERATKLRLEMPRLIERLQHMVETSDGAG